MPRARSEQQPRAQRGSRGVFFQQQSARITRIRARCLSVITRKHTIHRVFSLLAFLYLSVCPSLLSATWSADCATLCLIFYFIRVPYSEINVSIKSEADNVMLSACAATCAKFPNASTILTRFLNSVITLRCIFMHSTSWQSRSRNNNEKLSFPRKRKRASGIHTVSVQIML